MEGGSTCMNNTRQLSKAFVVIHILAVWSREDLTHWLMHSVGLTGEIPSLGVCTVIVNKFALMCVCSSVTLSPSRIRVTPIKWWLFLIENKPV